MTDKKESELPPGYERVEWFVGADLFGLGSMTYLIVCQTCASVVADPSKHERWHRDDG